MNGFAARAVAGDLGESRTGKEKDQGERILRSNEPSLEGPRSDNLPRISSTSKFGTTSELPERVEDWLANTVCGLLEVKKEDIDVDVSLSEFGFDSINFTNFARSINHDFGLELTPAIFFEPWTLRSLAIHLVDTHRERLEDKFRTHTGTESGVPPQEHRERPQAEITQPERWKRGRGRLSSRAISGSISEATSRRREEQIAIIGMSGRFPGAKDLEEFWANLEAGKESISAIPRDRWEYTDGEGDESRRAVKWGGFIDGIDEFDPLFFGISPREAEMIDPQQRLLMMYGWKAIEDAGYAPGQLWGSRTGVFVGTGNTGYNELLERPGIRIEGYSATGVVPSIGPCRLSYVLNLHGPSEPIETACSSSLVAIHRAVRAIHDGDCELALAGGVNTLLSPRLHVSFSKAGMLSTDGRCKTFSNRADGYVRSEGVGMVLLKRLEAAQRDGDHIYGLVRGTAENHGGRSNSLTAPNSQAQAELIKDAFRKAGISPRSVSYIEAHGTGTQLGDPTEINGLNSAFGALSEEMGEEAAASYCGLGSVKSNIGHSELAAGIAGVIKVLLQLKHHRLAKSLNCDEVNPYIRLDGTPFYIVRETQAWQRSKDEDGREWPLRAGVSSFGFGGVNAHVVIEEYTDAIAPEDAGRSVPAPGDKSSVLV
jgi:polyketide synthase PksN